MTPLPIRFGTDGWRGRIAEDFTFENVEIVTQALADFLGEGGGDADRPVLVGYDRRFLSERFAARVAEVLAGNGLRVGLYRRDLPTPIVSFDVHQERARAGVVITASHNPPEFNGFKLKESFGGSARPEVTAAVEARLGGSRPRRRPLEQAVADGLVEWRDPPDEAYFQRLRALVDVEAIRRSDWHILVDPIHGAADRYMERVLAGGRCRVETIRAERDPLFSGVNPEPMPQNLAALFEAVRATHATIGLAHDGDGDRLAAVGEDGSFITPHQIFPLLVQYLVRERGERGIIIRTFSQSVLVDRIADALGCPVRVVPIGFKYIADLMLTEDVLIGGEESGGIGVRGYLPERDGTFAGLLFLEALIARGERPSEAVRALWREFGEFHYRREDLHMPVERGKEIVARLTANPPDRVAGFRVVDVQTLDGTKLLLDDASWILFRQSGTEPVLRVYVEATSVAKRDQMIEAGLALVRELSTHAAASSEGEESR
ncbi:MAG: phosphoglucomutase/phosphomannomutase family protein [Blastocatellia bacterium]|nr:phosphoglucomutase/phosphomannomutase family protein [Blastocatellia bacterium]MCS7158205.1 phosphoglucomutase/phosphomannomutase family protein [Blastocatellia bacterium]MDW8169359.1 phosphoglucomutase/phosphomannomutase family protein [Acidobacteriota bacterium]MDW8255653.1 phosphoglucomutase/phosphomannomutase family protein [Acidobacteriota bacterium]